MVKTMDKLNNLLNFTYLKPLRSVDEKKALIALGYGLLFTASLLIVAINVVILFSLYTLVYFYLGVIALICVIILWVYLSFSIYLYLMGIKMKDVKRSLLMSLLIYGAISAFCFMITYYMFGG